MLWRVLYKCLKRWPVNTIYWYWRCIIILAVHYWNINRPNISLLYVGHDPKCTIHTHRPRHKTFVYLNALKSKKTWLKHNYYTINDTVGLTDCAAYERSYRRSQCHVGVLISWTLFRSVVLRWVLESGGRRWQWASADKLWQFTRTS